MGTKLYVGNLSYQTTQDQLQALFSQAGPVNDVAIVTDRETGRPRGFGFVEMANEAGARAAIDQFNGKEVDGRTLSVAEARPRENRDSRGPGGGGYRDSRDSRGGSGGGGSRSRW